MSLSQGKDVKKGQQVSAQIHQTDRTTGGTNIAQTSSDEKSLTARYENTSLTQTETNKKLGKKRRNRFTKKHGTRQPSSTEA